MSMIPFKSNFGLFNPHFGFPDSFDRMFKSFDFYPSAMNVMHTDIIEKDGNIELIMDLPGTAKEDIKIKLEEGNLIISANSDSNKSTEEHDSEGTYIRKERRSGAYTRSFYVGDKLTENDIKAKFENGTLKITFPKEKPEEIKKEKFIDID